MPKSVKFAVLFLMLSLVVSTANLFMQDIGIFEQPFGVKLGLFISFFLYFVVVFFVYKGKNFARVLLFIGMVFSLGFKLMAQMQIQESLIDASLIPKSSIWINVSTLSIFLGTILLLLPSSHRYFLKKKNFLEYIAWHPTRAFAFFVDLLILWLIYIVITYLFFDHLIGLSLFESRLMGFVGVVLYFVLFDTLWQTTPGKKLLFIKVVGVDNSKKSFRSNLVRILILFNLSAFEDIWQNSYYMIVVNGVVISLFLINIFLSLITRYNQTLYDLLTDSFVVYEGVEDRIDSIEKKDVKKVVITISLIVFTLFYIAYKDRSDAMSSNLVKALKKHKNIENAKVEFRSIPDAKGFHHRYSFIYIKLNKKIKPDSMEAKGLFLDAGRELVQNYLNPGEVLVVIFVYGVDFGISQYFIKVPQQGYVQAIKDQLFMMRSLK